MTCWRNWKHYRPIPKYRIKYVKPPTFRIEEEENEMRDIPRLIQACNEARESEEFKPRAGTTFCNFAVQFVAREMNCHDLNGMRANNMAEHMTESQDWLDVSEIDAQAHANRGALVVAAWRNPEGHPGHVTIVVPGIAGTSAKWRSNDVPMVLNIGETVFIGKGANWAFSDRPTYFLWADHL